MHFCFHQKLIRHIQAPFAVLIGVAAQLENLMYASDDPASPDYHTVKVGPAPLHNLACANASRAQMPRDRSGRGPCERLSARPSIWEGEGVLSQLEARAACAATLLRADAS